MASRFGPSGVLFLLLCAVAATSSSAQSPYGPPVAPTYAPPPTYGAVPTVPGSTPYRQPLYAPAGPTAPVPPASYPVQPYAQPSAAPVGPSNAGDYANRTARLPTIQSPPQPAIPGDLFAPTEVLARVGDQYVFRGDVTGDANVMIAPALMKMSPEEKEQASDQIVSQRALLINRMLVPEAINRKLRYVSFLRGIPPDKYQEAVASMSEKIDEAFPESLAKMQELYEKTKPEERPSLMRSDAQLYHLVALMDAGKLTSLGQLDLALRQHGSSLAKQKQRFAEEQLGRQALMGAIDTKPEVTYDEMVDFYRSNIDEFRVPQRARWEQLTILFSRVPDRDEAFRQVGSMGDQVYFGTPFSGVARQGSHGSQAKEGGYHDWVQWGDYSVSRELNEAIFTLPVGRLSRRIVDGEGVHIIRVIERQEEHIVSFRDAQTEIKKKIRAEKRAKSIEKEIAKLRTQIPVWSVFDSPEDSPQVAQPPGRGTSLPR